MKRIVHISDMHFGRTHDAAIGPLLSTIGALSPDLVVVSGDLTQRARHGEYSEAAGFLAEIGRPTLVIPGNHDIPLMNPYLRFVRPYKMFERYISTETESAYEDGSLAVIGLNSTRNYLWKDGKISIEQAESACAFFKTVPQSAFKVVVTHHPFDVSSAMSERDVIGGDTGNAMRMFDESKVDMFLAGHMHGSYVTTAWKRYKNRHNAIIAGVGTCISTRQRGNPLSMNEILVSPDVVELNEYAWEEGDTAFEIAAAHTYVCGESGWSEGTP